MGKVPTKELLACGPILNLVITILHIFIIVGRVHEIVKAAKMGTTT